MSVPDTKIDKTDHIQIHEELHRTLEELLTDFYAHNEGLDWNAPIKALVQWSRQQTTNPQTFSGKPKE